MNIVIYIQYVERLYMKLVVLGATGGTGMKIVSRALELGHSVTAFVRTPAKLREFADRITIAQGNLLNSA